MKVVKAWLPVAFVTTVLAGLVYVAGQQILRLGANDPQIQLAEDWAAQIAGGTLPDQINLGAAIDPAASLAIFGIVYDGQGKIIAGSVKRPAAMQLPDGVLASVDKSSNTEDRFTWQPAGGQRFATVIKRTHGADGSVAYVLAARNMRELEKRESQLLAMATFAWLVALSGSFYLQYLARRGAQLIQ